MTDDRWRRVDSGDQQSSDRGVSTTLDYTLTLAVATLVITALFIGVGDFVTDRREQVIRTEMEVIGQHVVRDVQAIDRLAQAGTGADNATLERELPSRITGSIYKIEIDTSGSQTQLKLSTSDPEVSVEIPIQTQTGLVATTINGGDLTITYDAAADQVEVQS